MTEETQEKIIGEMRKWVDGSVDTTNLYLTMVSTALSGGYDADEFSKDTAKLFNHGMRDAARSADFAIQFSAFLASQAPK